MTREDVKQLLNVAYEACDIIEEKGLWGLQDEYSMRELLRLDLAKFLLYLSFADEKITDEEVEFFADLLNFNTNAEEIIDIVKENHIYSTQFETQIPLIIQGASYAQKKLTEMGIEPKRKIIDLFIECYEKLGFCFNVCDGLDGREVRDYQIYIKTLKHYAENSDAIDCSYVEIKENM